MVSIPEATLTQAYRHCQDVTRQQARNFYFAFLSLPREQRQSVYAVYAFCRACDDYSDDDIDPRRKVDLLESYRHRLHECFEGHPSGPVFEALRDVAERYHISRDLFDDIITGVRMDLTMRRYATFDDLYKYCYRVASVVGLVSVEIFGYTDAAARAYAIDMGIGMQLVNIMRDVKEDAGRDRIYLPQEDLKRFGCSESDVLGGIQGAGFAEMMKFEAGRARRYFQRGELLLPLVPPRTRACPLILKTLYSRLLDRIEARNWDVFHERVRLSTAEKLWLVGKISAGTALRSALPPGRSSS